MRRNSKRMQEELPQPGNNFVGKKLSCVAFALDCGFWKWWQKCLHRGKFTLQRRLLFTQSCWKVSSSIKHCGTRNINVKEWKECSKPCWEDYPYLRHHPPYSVTATKKWIKSLKKGCWSWRIPQCEWLLAKLRLTLFNSSRSPSWFFLHSTLPTTPLSKDMWGWLICSPQWQELKVYMTFMATPNVLQWWVWEWIPTCLWWQSCPLQLPPAFFKGQHKWKERLRQTWQGEDKREMS